MLTQFRRTEHIYGKEAMKKLYSSRVAVFGLGGVGGYALEALARSGIGCFDIIDNDKVCLTNINRQILATHKTIGKYKVNVAKERILEINPSAKVNIHNLFYMPDTADLIDLSVFDYIVDAIDTISAKVELIVRAKESNIPIISSMGAGNKIGAQFEVADIFETSVCPLAKVMRRELKLKNIKSLKVVYSKEPPKKPFIFEENKRKTIPGSTAFVPPIVGLILAGEIINDITGVNKNK